jgi:hypothetical protein
MSLPPYTPAQPSKEPCKYISMQFQQGSAALLTTSHTVDYVKLVNIDLSKFETQEGRQELARDLFEAATGYGFLTLTNHGISDEIYKRQMQIANAVMTLPAEEKEPYEGKMRGVSPWC